MNRTPNYSLNQWEAEDKVQRTDFNADNAKIDAALAGKAEAAKLAALTALVAEIEPLARERTICGSFQGDQTAGRLLPLPWVPKLVFLVGDVTARSCLGVLTADFFMNIGLSVESTVYTPGYGDYSYFPAIQGSSLLFKSSHFNKGTVFYIAFR